MGVFRTTVVIDFKNPRQQALRDWLATTGLDPKSLPSLSIEVSTNVELKDFDDDELAERYEELFHNDPHRVDRAYRYIAEGDCVSAMEELAREFGLAPPSHERAIADLLTGNRIPAHVQG